MAKILITDNSPIFRAGVRQVLTGACNGSMLEEAGSLQELFERLHETRWDAILLDLLQQADTSGIDLLAKLHRLRPGLPILILTNQPENHYAVRLLRAGAAGYLTKDAPCEALIHATRRVAQGGKYVSPRLAEIIASTMGQESRPIQHDVLSDREYEILCMLASGKRVSEIAQELFLSTKTVSTYRLRILEKMEMKKTAELMYYAIKNQLVD